jgi:hypothetical protein
MTAIDTAKISGVEDVDYLYSEYSSDVLLLLF